MTERFEWKTADFETLSWHDCSVYGFTLEEKDHGTGDLLFDIDFIVEWLCHKDRPWEWRVGPATLTFHNIFGLRFEVDYAAASAAIEPFTLDGIEREELRYPNGATTYKWRLPINWPKGLITFEGPGFTQVLRQPPILIDRQALLLGERRPIASK